jgi:hypothetical protein
MTVGRSARTHGPISLISGFAGSLALAVTPARIELAKLGRCLVAERYWDQARWAIEAYAWRFDGLERAAVTGGAA